MSDRTLDRRAFLKTMLATAGCFSGVATAFAQAPVTVPASEPNNRYRFPQGVASGDPQPDMVVLWTRVEDSDGGRGPVKVTIQVSKAEYFADLILEQNVTVTEASDHTLRYIVEGLQPDTTYYYRFIANGNEDSRIGRTRTAPEPQADRAANFAFACCQNYEQGFYGAWARMIADDKAAPADKQIDFILFLGDFIYEVRGDRAEAQMLTDPRWLVSKDGTPRAIPAFPNGSSPWPVTSWNEHGGATNAVSLADYRHLYKLYLTDPHLQEARARWPFISIWDDHEFTNDSWQGFETYPMGGKPAQRRKVAANQAWFEYIPALLTNARPMAGTAQAARDFTYVEVTDEANAPSPTDWSPTEKATIDALASLTIYRTLRWGKHCELILTDLRSYRSPPVWTDELKEALDAALAPTALVRTLDEGRNAGGGNPPATFEGKKGQVANPRKDAPPGTMMGAIQKQWFKDVLKASNATWKIWANSTPAIAMRVDASNIPFAGAADLVFGTDGWGGFPGELRELMSYIREAGITNVVSCAGDYHVHAAGLITTDPDAEEPVPAIVEIASAGISSTTVYGLLERATRNGSSFRALVTTGEGDAMENNWNRTMTGGTLSAIVYSSLGWSWFADWFWNANANPGLLYFESESYGYGQLTVGASAAQGRLVNFPAPITDSGSEPPFIAATRDFDIKPWTAGELPTLT